MDETLDGEGNGREELKVERVEALDKIIMC